MEKWQDINPMHDHSLFTKEEDQLLSTLKKISFADARRYFPTRVPDVICTRWRRLAKEDLVLKKATDGLKMKGGGRNSTVGPDESTLLSPEDFALKLKKR